MAGSGIQTDNGADAGNDAQGNVGDKAEGGQTNNGNSGPSSKASGTGNTLLPAQKSSGKPVTGQTTGKQDGKPNNGNVDSQSGKLNSNSANDNADNTAGDSGQIQYEPPTNNPAVDTDKINEIKSDVSAADKVKVASYVLKRLTQADVKKLTNMLAGGLTTSELAEAKAIAYSRFSPAEIVKIKEMYRKYMEDNKG